MQDGMTHPKNTWQAFEDTWLAPYAMRGSDSLGRQHAEPAHPFRSIYQRDRERIIHCSGFRRLMGKTQVLAGQVNDHHRTRLTHTLEVVQISRTIARRLRLNEDLTEAIALSHDLGHPPFGHVGERALAALMHGQGGFEHNLFGLRRVDWLEDRYPDFPGLNLSWEVREGFVQHAKNRIAPECEAFLKSGGPLLEQQLADAADSLAYDTHDIDDALVTNLIGLDDLNSVSLWRHGAEIARQTYTNLTEREFQNAVIRELIAWQVMDLITQTEKNLQTNAITSVADARLQTSNSIAFSNPLAEQKTELEKFLRERVYRHHQVLRMAQKGKRIIEALFNEFLQDPELLPAHILRRYENCPARLHYLPCKVQVGSLAQVICDYIAGMTDRYACQEFKRLFQPDA
jgi:dGTPase